MPQADLHWYFYRMNKPQGDQDFGIEQYEHPEIINQPSLDQGIAA
jgi:hypothetical protein